MLPSDMDNSSFAPARRAEAVTPHATNPLPSGPADFLFVGTGGTVVCRPVDSAADVTFTVGDGTYLWCKVSHVRISGASGIVACYTKRS